MKKLSTLTLAVLATACAASAFAAPAPAKDGVKDPESGITLHPPKHDTSAAPGTKQKKLSDEVKAAMQRVAMATKKVVHRADEALRDATHNDKA
jgi:Spy/CpxP family protein refolding chaperone